VTNVDDARNRLVSANTKRATSFDNDDQWMPRENDIGVLDTAPLCTKRMAKTRASSSAIVSFISFVLYSLF
jgi:hypothetical protein